MCVCIHDTIYILLSRILCCVILRQVIRVFLYPIESISDFKRKSSFTTNKYAEVTMPTAMTYSTKKAFHLQSRNTNQRIYEGYYAATDILTVGRWIRCVCKNSNKGII